MGTPPYDLDNDYYLGAEYSTDGTDPWLGTSYVLRNWLNNWFSSRCCGIPKTEPTLGETGDDDGLGVA